MHVLTALELANDRLAVTVLPGRGADIAQVRHVPTGTDLLLEHTPPDAPPDVPEFLRGYAGGWQEMFPSIEEACVHRGREIPFHGEVALLPWEVEAQGEDRARLSVECRCMPFALTREMRLRADAAELVLDERVRNVGDSPAELVWGHHCVLGPPFLEPGCRLAAPAREVVAATGPASPWPNDALSRVPGPEAGSEEDAYLTGLDGGWVAVANPRLGLTVRLTFDPHLFRGVAVWMPFGGATHPSLRGIYGLGIEPVTSRHCLADAAAHGEAVTLSAGAELTTTLALRVEA